MELAVQIIVYSIIVLFFGFEVWLSNLNYMNRHTEIPEEVNDIYDTESYKKWLEYYMENHRFSLIIKSVNTLIFILLLALGGFSFIDSLVGNIGNIYTQLFVFLAIYQLFTMIVSIPFDYYATFVIEEKYGFNKTTKKLFVIDIIKNILLLATIGGGIVIGLFAFYANFDNIFIILSWAASTTFILIVNVIYVPVIVPIFNKLIPLEDGELKDMINEFASSVGYEVTKISIMDASKRSTKLNAFFAGLGKYKQVVLYDTLIEKMSNEEIVAVLAHEIGHSKHKHIRFNLFQTSFNILLLFVVLYIILSQGVIMSAFGIENVVFGFGLLLFSVFMNPISVLIGLVTSYYSRKHEYEADRYAATKFKKEPMISALKVLSRENFSNLTPHPLFVRLRYSHPPTVDRIRAIIKG
jgi:STE24 endopeptidase